MHRKFFPLWGSHNTTSCTWVNSHTTSQALYLSISLLAFLSILSVYFDSMIFLSGGCEIEPFLNVPILSIASISVFVTILNSSQFGHFIASSTVGVSGMFSIPVRANSMFSFLVTSVAKLANWCVRDPLIMFWILIELDMSFGAIGFGLEGTSGIFGSVRD